LLDSIPASKSEGAPVVIDAEGILPSVANVPVEDLLAFRAEFGHYFKAHAALLTTSMERLSLSATTPSEAELAACRDELASSAEALRRLGRLQLGGGRGYFGLGVSGNSCCRLFGDVRPPPRRIDGQGQHAPALHQNAPVSMYTYFVLHPSTTTVL
jgi:hypothetical protein